MKSEGKSWVEKIINILLNFFIFVFSIILLISIYNNIQTKLLKKSYSDFFGFSMFEVQTGSMADEINPGDWIIVKSSNSFKLNDIVTYKLNDDYITHRIIEVYNGTYVTKGDANNTKDSPISQDQIVGKVVKILPHFGIFKKTIFNPAVLVAIIITILVCNFVFKKKKQSNEKENAVVVNIKEKISKMNNNIEKLKITKLEKKEPKVEIKEEKEEEIKNLILEPQEEEIIEEEKEEVSQFIPVDISEIDDTFLEIAENEIEEPVKEVVKEPEIEIKEEKKVSKVNLELLESSSIKKSKNIIDKVITIKIEELNEIINILQDEVKFQVNEPTIKNKFLEAYIESKYYNYYGEKNDSNGKKTSGKIDKYLKEKAEEFKKTYKSSDTKYSEKVDKFLNMFILIANLEQAKDSISDTKAKNEFYKKEIIKFSKEKKWNGSKIKTVITNIMKVQRNYVGIVDYFYKKLETNMFSLNINKLASRKNLYGLSLEHNIYFSKVYSDYIIDKTYSEGVIAEDKMTVMLTLLSAQIVQDMMASEFNKRYIITVPKSLYSKEKKFEKILKLIDDEYAKEAVILLVGYEDLIKHKTKIKKLSKEGYKFSISLGKESKLEEKHFNNMYVADYIFVDKKITNLVKMLSDLPEDLMDKVVYEDISKEVGDFGGE